MSLYMNKTTRGRVAECIRIGTPLQDIRRQFNVTEGNVIEVLQQLGMFGTASVTIGGKNEAYFEGDFPPEMPKYSVKDLSGDEETILVNEPVYSFNIR